MQEHIEIESRREHKTGTKLDVSARWTTSRHSMEGVTECVSELLIVARDHFYDFSDLYADAYKNEAGVKTGTYTVTLFFTADEPSEADEMVETFLKEALNARDSALMWECSCGCGAHSKPHNTLEELGL
jgi:hypothetical protein